MSLHVRARLSARDFDVELRVAEGTTTAVLGPNGAGKSTLVGLIAGLLRADEGRATLGTPASGERILFDTERRLHLPPHRRSVALLAQDPLLFPHLSVLDNVAFGPRSTGASRSASAAIARTWLDAVEAADLAGRRPAELSGGQAQRVALARALAPSPELLLLDEPMAALDVSVAPLLRRMLRRVLPGRTTILITHDVLDAYTLADRVVVLHGGRVIEDGPTHEVLERPQSPFTAELAALNLLTGVATGTGLRTDDGLELRVADASGVPVGARAAAAFRPAAVSVGPADTRAPGPDRLRARIRDLERRGDLVRVRAAAISADLSPAQLAALGAGIGDEVDFTVDPAAVALYPHRA
ncbi:ABC transporter ATP-binding protein [Rathayibacter sp. VKM Ac-2856]|uniref:sulfate/molybdate ABC transporter ATP-binding protein n=1 Tax=unclassified Rathayibacter TaxID=2609250 RepID=UPI0015630B93|nr:MULTISPECIES: ABC transporter ATP-binding protein [unclassified Rathayibacter]NQX03480.1 ABC transporter ATP-binding protein [Rathayibacter sp. VKM Ac-2858]NQX18648.1 ABC transporter ATP-binding protein [Rathayibacter sp. VKM Ac-2856]